MMNALDILKAAYPVMPVIVLDDIEQALPLANALYEGGVKVFEVTLRSDCAAQAIKLLKQEMPNDCIIGAGTVINKKQLERVIELKADFVVSPGITDELSKAAKTSGRPFIPGVSTPSELMSALDYGYSTLKFFPAEQSGGIKMLKALSGPFSNISFCPTGGINPDNYADYLSLSNVECVGGSWIAPMGLIREGDWQAITKLARKLI